LCWPRSFSSSDDSSEPGRSEAGTPRAVDAANRIYLVVLSWTWLVICRAARSRELAQRFIYPFGGVAAH
jgi:hypothetical protein